MGKKAFTLSEVLITLGIIGVVAAMTLPALIQNHTKKVVETRLKKFYTVFNQAIQMAEVKHGDKKSWYIDASGVEVDEEGKPILATSEIDRWFNTYLTQFIVLKRKSDSDGRLLYYLADGTAFQLGTQGNPSLRDIYFYPGNPEKCQGKDREIVGRCVWKFEYMPTKTSVKWKYAYNKGLVANVYGWDGTEDMLKNDSQRGCYVDSELKSFCTMLIMQNGWEIPKDYPWKVRY